MDGDFCPFSAPVVRVVCVEEQLSYVHRVRGVLKRSGVVLRCRGTPGPGAPSGDSGRIDAARLVRSVVRYPAI